MLEGWAKPQLHVLWMKCILMESKWPQQNDFNCFLNAEVDIIDVNDPVCSCTFKTVL